jgi:hypothetical protein
LGDSAIANEGREGVDQSVDGDIICDEMEEEESEWGGKEKKEHQTSN